MPGKHQHFQDPEVGCCGKYFLFGFNIVFWVSAGSASCPALGSGARQPVFLAGGESLPRNLRPGTVPDSFHPDSQSLRTTQRELLGFLWGGGGGTQSQQGRFGSLALQPQVWAKKGAAFVGRLQGRGSCGMSPAPPPGHASSRHGA